MTATATSTTISARLRTVTTFINRKFRLADQGSGREAVAVPTSIQFLRLALRCDSPLYPLFDDDLIRLMRETVPHDKQDSVAISVALRAKLTNVGSLN
jgi:hypothetical protein